MVTCSNQHALYLVNAFIGHESPHLVYIDAWLIVGLLQLYLKFHASKMVNYQSVCVYWRWPAKLARFQVWTVVCSAFFIHFSLGAVYDFSNMVPYVISYIRVYSSPSFLQMEDAPYVTAAHILGHAVVVGVGGMLEKKIGPRLATLLGIVIMDIGILLSYWTIQVSFWLFLATYGLVAGIGGGLAYIGPITCAMKWLPKWKGLVSGLIVGSFGLSRMTFDIVQTAYINPQNLRPSYCLSPDDCYFIGPLLHKVPNIFFITLGSVAAFQLIGCVFLVNPPPISSFPPSPFPSLSSSPLLINGSSNTGKTKTALAGSDSTEYHSKYLSINAEPEQQKANGGLKPFLALTKKNFYVIWFMFFCAGVCSSFIGTMFKAFGLDEVVDDDHFLTMLGVVSAVFGFVGRIGWGFIADMTSYTMAFAIQTAIMTCTLLTLLATTLGGGWMYFVWICIAYFCFGGNYCLFPTAVAKSFGQTNMGIVYGLVFTSHAISGIIAAFITSQMVRLIGWDGLFFILSGISGLEFGIVLLYKHKTYR